jgi:ATP-dependent DNA helicase RecG
LQEVLGLKHEEHFREAYLTPALAGRIIDMTIPDKPRSSKQKYQLTALGCHVREKLKKEAKTDG